MIISSNGIVLNEYSDVLLVQRDDTRTLAPPGGACEIDELPGDAVAREVREETGLVVHPVRLVGLHFLPTSSQDFLFLCFRCIQRGGELSPSEETPRAGFFTSNPLPGSMLAFHKEQVENAFNHKGGPPYWANHHVNPLMRLGLLMLNRVVYPWLSFRRARLGLPAHNPPPDWQVRATLILSNANRELLLLRNENSDTWSLPTTKHASSEPPWALAERLTQLTSPNGTKLTGLSGIYLRKGIPRMEFVFTGSLPEETRQSDFSSELFAADLLPTQLPPEQRSFISDAQKPDYQITYGLLKDI